MSPGNLRGIRTLNWLYVRDRDRPSHLFDLKADREELVNLADDPDHVEILAELDARVIQNMEEIGDEWGLAPHFPPPGLTSHEQRIAHMRNVVMPAVIEVP